MDPLLLEKRPAIEALCRAYGVQRLYVFGSAATGTRRADSDFDFSVVFELQRPENRGSNHKHLIRGLSEVLQDAQVDIVDEEFLKNKFFLEELTETKLPLYDAEKLEAFTGHPQLS
jgi:uncharacterized protein